ncbi:MAG: (2Fe-2S)-binding protein [Pseudomonadota bacterium]|nr:(2Fe-2S)-binding protein [Pseudomonadota bacterium]
MLQLTVNGTLHTVDVAPDTPLLWVVRDHLGLTGTKFGCGMGLCGSCTMIVAGSALRTCVLPASAAVGQDILTIEGLPAHPVKDAWLAEQVPQCGYCQPGQIMTAVAFLETNPTPTDADIRENVTNLCRCGTYERIRKAIHRAALARASASAVPAPSTVPAPEAPAPPASKP